MWINIDLIRSGINLFDLFVCFVRKFNGMDFFSISKVKHSVVEKLFILLRILSLFKFGEILFFR
ncbi:hypothetical protein BTJ40_03195 [Microbulbifer sp. A4B17]|nr:hypothetical protein BTJ40_03195 [Microbulbifer sp. A4B17]